MKQMILRRIAENEDGVFGVLIDVKDNQNIPFAVTVEPNWRDNQKNISCIPIGSYICKRRLYNRRGYWTFEITDVPNRSNVLIHIGNDEDDTEGCVLVAEQFGMLESKTAILHSSLGFSEFMDRLEGHDEFVLEIKKCYIERE